MAILLSSRGIIRGGARQRAEIDRAVTAAVSRIASAVINVVIALRQLPNVGVAGIASDVVAQEGYCAGFRYPVMYVRIAEPKKSPVLATKVLLVTVTLPYTLIAPPKSALFW